MTGILPNTLGAGDLGVYLLNFETEKYIRDCENAPLVTACVKKFYDKNYGTNYNSKFNKTADLALTNFNGQQNLKKRTGCLKTCVRTKYDLTEFYKFAVKNMADPNIKGFLKQSNDTVSPTVIINHLKSEKIIQHEEVLEYDLSKFVSDSGGTIGIFVGLSFWSIFVDFISPVIKWIEKRCQNKKSN